MLLNKKALALTFGVLWGLSIFFAVLWVILLDGATGEPLPIAVIYRGTTASFLGAIIGLGWGLLDGLIGGWLVAWLYNRLAA